MTKNISCIIRTYNEAKLIGKLINTLCSQKNIGSAIEIIVVDSGSTDGTVDIVKNLDVKLIEILKVEFNYSRSLNLGIENSTGDLIVILSAHSVPCDNDWLQKMVAWFEDRNVAGVYCRQIPWPGTGLPEIVRIEKMFSENSRSFSKENSNANMSFSNAASCIRRTVWKEHPFVIMPAAEDREWASWAIENGYSIIYEAEAQVYHSHSESCRKAAQRMIHLEKAADIRLSRRRNLVLTIKQSIGWSIRGIKDTLSATCGKSLKVRLASQYITRSFWYIVDFNQETK